MLGIMNTFKEVKKEDFFSNFEKLPFENFIIFKICFYM